MKKTFPLVLIMILLLLSLASCTGEPAENQTDSSVNAVESSSIEETKVTSEESTELSSEESKEVSEDEKTTAPAVSSIEAEDASAYDTKENAAPLGQWVKYVNKNYTSDTYEPFYVRITSVSRDQTAVQSELDSYDGIMDLTLSEDQARDIEYGIVEYEIYFAPDYAASDYGISVPSISWGASPIQTAGFKTDGGMSYIG